MTSSGMSPADKLYSLWFIVLGIAILFRTRQLANWPLYLVLHFLVLAAIFILARYQSRNSHWRFWHDWYPVLLFIIAFEETARLSLAFRSGWQDHLILAFEGRLFATPPTVWLDQFSSPLFTELMEVGYFSFYIFFILVGGLLYFRARRSSAPDTDRAPHIAFRDLMSATVVGYIICYIVYLAFPTESPARTLSQTPVAQLPGGPFHWAVNLIQHHGGVHGNAFPSGHIMSSAVTLLFAWRYTRRLGWFLLPLFLLMCVGSVYDRYHYFSDVVAGALLGVAVSVPFLRTKHFSA